MERTFSYINDERIGELISSAKRYAIYAAPSISKSTAQALVSCCQQNSGLKTHIVLDVDAEPMRLGFGDREGLQFLFEHGVVIRKATGLRVGVIVVDDEAWVYAPTPEIILHQPDETLSNAVKVNTDFALEMIPAIAPEIAKELNILAATIIRENGEKRCEPEIGQAIAVEADIKAVEQSIAENPPVKFDYERRLRVYKSLFQFVDFRFIGGKITSHTITIPPELLNIAEEDSDLRNRIRSTCRLVDESNPFARKFKEFGWKIHKLRKDYTCPLGERYGSIILRKIRPEFDEMVEKARTDMKALTENVAAELQKAIDENRAKLVDLLLPGFKQNPPASLRSRTVSDITEENAREHIQEILSRVIPAASELVGTMQLNCDYKDITYEMLTDKDFVALVKEKFRLDIDALHTEESAAGERSAPV